MKDESDVEEMGEEPSAVISNTESEKQSIDEQENTHNGLQNGHTENAPPQLFTFKVVNNYGSMDRETLQNDDKPLHFNTAASKKLF